MRKGGGLMDSGPYHLGQQNKLSFMRVNGTVSAGLQQAQGGM
jgi:hypothetical protein